MFNVEDLPRSLTIRQAKLAMLRGLYLEKRCPCGACTIGAIDRMIDRYGPDLTIRELLPRLCCKQCNRTGYEMALYLLEGMHREPCGGPSPGWSLALHQHQPESLPA